jgi:Dolichyl-phosphate-mannose-protein mannosyltransferase
MKTRKKTTTVAVNRKFDFIIPIIFIISMIGPIIVASTQYYIVEYSDDIICIDWARTHGTSVIDIVTAKLGTGFRPMMNFWYALSYNLWGAEPRYYYLLNGILFSGSMVFLYLIGKILYNSIAGAVAVSLYLFLDASFILISKINFIATIGELFFITSAIYFSLNYLKNNDTRSKLLAIILSILAFLSKEPSLLIIPVVNLSYMWYNELSKRNYIIMNLLPFIYMSMLYFFISPDVGAGDGNVTQRFIDNLKFYIDMEVHGQFITPVLLLISFVFAEYYIIKQKSVEQMAICLLWFIAGLLPLLITQQIVQPTYLAEANLGMVLLIGLVVAKGLREDNFIRGIIIIGIIVQAIYIPEEIANRQWYNNGKSNQEKVFFDTVNSLHEIPTDTVFYIPEKTRSKYDSQISEQVFQQYLCLRDLCNIKVTTNYSQSDYIILPSMLDTDIFKLEYPNAQPKEVVKKIEIGEDVGFIMKK